VLEYLAAREKDDGDEQGSYAFGHRQILVLKPAVGALRILVPEPAGAPGEARHAEIGAPLANLLASDTS
jgi:hypothetical protein